MSRDESNETLRGRKCEDALPPGLEAVEAELASLRPRDDRLDRERLIFLAGQASVGGRSAARRLVAARWAWPGACAGMTAVAATLLVALLLRPEPPVVERIRIVEVPVESRDSALERPARDVGPDADSPATPRRPDFQPRPAWRTLASGHADSPSRADWNRFGSRAEYLEMFERMLARGVDPWRQPLGVSSRGEEQADTPVPYRQWLKTMLDDQARAEPPGDRPSNPSRSGANS